MLRLAFILLLMNTKMTDSINKKSKENRYRTNSSRLNSTEIALIEDIPDDEDAIDRLLQNADFNSPEEADDRWGLPLDLDESESASAIVSRYLIKRKIEPQIRGANGHGPSLSRNDDVLHGFRAPRGKLDEPPGIVEINAHNESNKIDPIDIARNETIDIEDFGELNASKSDGPQATTDIDLNPTQDRQVDFVDEPFSGSFAEFVAKQQALNLEQNRVIENLAYNGRKAILLSYLAFASALAAVALTLTLMISSWQDNRTNPAIQSAVPVNGTDHTESFIPKTVSASSSISENMQWYVDLATFNQRAEAVDKAAEFIKKGIRSELFEAETDHSTSYVLRVGGFSSQAQAESYSEKIKLALQLNSVRISRYPGSRRPS